MEDGKGGGWKRGQQRAYFVCFGSNRLSPYIFPFHESPVKYEYESSLVVLFPRLTSLWAVPMDMGDYGKQPSVGINCLESIRGPDRRLIPFIETCSCF